MAYQQINQEERYYISAFCKAGFSVKEIADFLKRHKSTIYREIKRNKGKRGYRPKQAHEKAIIRRRSSHKRITITDRIIDAVKIDINKQWSPKQVSNRLKLMMNLNISHQSIYAIVYEDKLLGGELYKQLRQGNKKRRKKYGKNSGKRGQIKNKKPISIRPEYVNKRTTFGHWEGDTIIGKNHKKAMITLVERKSGFLLIEKVETKNAEHVAEKIIKAMSKYKNIVKTITFDNGLEFACFEKIEKELSCRVFFADAYSSYQRGTNENTNGLIRQYFPKGSDFDCYLKSDVRKVMNKLNNRPRERHGFFTPNEVLFGK